jgi:hypothetical protein
MTTRHVGRIVLATSSLLPLLHALMVRPRMLTWGATPDEVAHVYPGDEIVPDAVGTSTMATTLPAPPPQVWAWLVQMGYDRAGWYSWDRLDRGGIASAEHVVPEWQRLKEGQRLQATPTGETWFTVARLEPHRTLVLSSDLALPSGRSLTRADALPSAYAGGIWAFHLRPTDDDGTRLVVRTRGTSRPRAITRPFDLLFGEPAHFIMQTRQFHNLRRRLQQR